MSFIDILSMTLRSLWRRKARTFLTVLGVIIGTACIVIMLALGLGNEKAYYEQISQNVNLTQISIYNWGGGFQSGSASNRAKLDDAAIRSFLEIDGVSAATPVLNIPVGIKTGKYAAEYYQMMAVDPKAMKDAFDIEKGRTLPDQASGKFEFVAGYGSLMNFQRENSTVYSDQPPDIDWLNAKFEMTLGYSYEYEDDYDSGLPKSKVYKPKMIGIMPENYNEFSYSGVMDIADAKKMLSQNRKLAEELNINYKNYETAYVFCIDMDHVMDVLDTIKEMGYEAVSDTEWIKTQQEELNRQRMQLASIGLISLLVSAIGIANTMLTSILERTKEIGIMKVLGCSLFKINLLFLTESAMIGLFGGLIGLGLSFAFQMVAGSLGAEALGFLNINMMGMGDGTNQMLIPAWLALGAIGFSSIIGILSGLYPAWRAMRMSPLAAIRSE